MNTARREANGSIPPSPLDLQEKTLFYQKYIVSTSGKGVSSLIVFPPRLKIKFGWCPYARETCWENIVLGRDRMQTLDIVN